MLVLHGLKDFNIKWLEQMSFMQWSIECRSLPFETEVDKFKGKV